MKFKKASAVLLACAVLSAALAGCGKIDQDAVAATLNGDTEISLGYANFMARYGQVSYDSFFASYYGEGYWTSDEYAQDGVTMEESVKTSIMDSIETAYLLELHMPDYGVEITQEEQAAIQAAAAQFMEDNSNEAIRELGATQEYVEQMLYYETVQQKMNAAIREEADADVSLEEAAQRTFSYARIDLSTYTDGEGNTQEYTAEEADQARETAEDAAKAAMEDFDAAMENYGYTVSTYSYGDDEASEADGGFNDAVIEAADKMKEGEVSGLIEGEDCCYIIRLDSEFDEEASEQKRQSMISEIQNDHYTEVTDGYREAAEFEINEKEWAKVKFDNLFTMAAPESGDTAEQ